MVLIMVTVWFPPTKAIEAMKKTSEVYKKIPFASFEKSLVWGGKCDKEGEVVIRIIEVKKGKLEESLSLVRKRMFMFNSIEGYNHKTEILMTTEEAMASMGVAPPK